MAEDAFLVAVETWLAGVPLQPTAASIGPAEPTAPGELPAAVLSLSDATHEGSGLGRRTELMTDGALALQVTIDMANPVLPLSPPEPAWDPSTLLLTLPHGGLVAASGGGPPTGAADIDLRVAGVPWTLTASSPPAASFEVLADQGQLRLGQAPGPTDVVVVDYHVGQWERRAVRVSGELRVDVVAASVAEVRTLTRSVIARLRAATAGVASILALDVRELGTVGPPEAVTQGRRRRLAFQFEYEHTIDEPAASGGIIRVVPIESRLLSLAVDRGTQAIVESVTVETG